MSIIAVDRRAQLAFKQRYDLWVAFGIKREVDGVHSCVNS